MRFETKVIHVGESPNFLPGGSGDAVSPIHLSSTFARQKVETPTLGYEYSRTLNPTRKALEERLASLENAQYGLAFASGMAAETSLILALLKSSDHIIAFDDLYGGSRRLFSRIMALHFQIDISYVDARDIKAIEENFRPNTKIIWLETPTNPLLKICDIKKIVHLAHDKMKSSKQPIYVVVDNTFASPYFQRPLELGADIVLHSTTKYINGHSDSVGGAIMLNDENIFEKLKFTQNAAGAILSPFDSYLVLRGVKTLALRMQQHEKNAVKISQFLAQHPRVAKVYYPGLPSHPQHELAKQQMSGFGAMISFELHGGMDEAKRFVESLQYFLIAESLGGVESLVEIPSLMTHASVSPEDRSHIGLTDNLIRLSVGIENCEDLLDDLKQAFL